MFFYPSVKFLGTWTHLQSLCRCWCLSGASSCNIAPLHTETVSSLCGSRLPEWMEESRWLFGEDEAADNTLSTSVARCVKLIEADPMHWFAALKAPKTDFFPSSLVVPFLHGPSVTNKRFHQTSGRFLFRLWAVSNRLLTGLARRPASSCTSVAITTRVNLSSCEPRDAFFYHSFRAAAAALCSPPARS